MTVNDIYSFLDERFPFSLACDFDNAGLLLGDKNATVTKAVVCLDCTVSAVDKAIDLGAELIISHHPVIFSGLKEVLSDSIVHRIIQNNISVISAHTNLDSACGGVNDTLASILELENVESVTGDDGLIYRKGTLKNPLSPAALAKFVGEKLGIAVRYATGTRDIKTVAVCGGSGADFLYDTAAQGLDALVTADVKHHFFVDADRLGITLIDGGHFHTENVVINPLTALLQKQFPDIIFTADNTAPVKSI